ncbi:hypothetical protein KIPB_009701 [Kipferlia bialata]|uniref:SAM domain-containing protein n=1 Tax=Kipferlia bialata TaxID=797122 RepID=A0A9K3D280_9EUKA|nr:hypothetical protein KIPB_009701 [Kipferlia bialata]|eukprot:g9701.t1
MDQDSQPVAKLWPVESWTKNDVCVWLNSVNMRKYSENFRKNDICGRSMMLLTEDDLRYMDVESLGDRKAMMYEIQRLDKWKGFLWRSEVVIPGTADKSVSLELLLSLSPSRMYALCTVRQVWLIWIY